METHSVDKSIEVTNASPVSGALTSTDDELAALRAEVLRLRSLVGPSETDYRKLHLDLLGARDHAIAAEARLGHFRGRIEALESENFRLRRSSRWAIDSMLVRVMGPNAVVVLRPVALVARKIVRMARRLSSSSTR